MGLVQQPSSHALNTLFIPSYSPPPSHMPPAPLSTMCSSTSNAEVPSRGPDCPTAAPPPPARAMSSFTHMSSRKFRGGMLVLSGAVHAAAAAAAALHIPCSHIEWLPSPIGTGRDGTGECVAIAGIAEQVSTALAHTLLMLQFASRAEHLPRTFTPAIGTAAPTAVASPSSSAQTAAPSKIFQHSLLLFSPQPPPGDAPMAAPPPSPSRSTKTPFLKTVSAGSPCPVAMQCAT